jgi:hypothetical protein
VYAMVVDSSRLDGAIATLRSLFQLLRKMWRLGQCDRMFYVSILADLPANQTHNDYDF